MSLHLLHFVRRFTTLGAFTASIFAFAVNLHAANGTWTSPVDGTWSNGANWASGTVADGANSIANFSTIDVTDQEPVTTFPAVGVELDTPRTVGHLTFADTNPATPGAWDIFTNDAINNILTLSDATKPTITVNPLGPVGTTGQDAARVLVNLAGTQGFNKLGTGVLTVQGTGNTITGGIGINQGTLRVTGAIPAQTFTFANGATLAPVVSMDAVGTRIFSVAPGDTANLSITGSVEVGRFDAEGANINVNFPAATAANAVFHPSGNWLASSATASPATFVISSAGPAPTALATPSVSAAIAQTGAVVRLAPNRSGTTIRNFNGNTFFNTAVTVNNTVLAARTNSGGNTFNFGSLSGDATAILTGGNAGSFANYSIGALNTDTTFAGTIDMATSTGIESTGGGTGGLNLTKVGTGKLTLSGTLNYPPTNNGTVNRRGGITTVSAGTLALTNNAAIAGGINDAAVGDILSTVNILAGATLDVSGYSGNYSTAPIQQVVGSGTVVGNYSHDEGIIRPGNTINGTTSSGPSPSVPTAGTINFANNFNWNGGTYTYDLTLNPSSGNDLISVGGITTLTSGTVVPNFLGGVPSSGTYTLLTSAGGFSGAASNITVDWPGRGTDPVATINGNNLQFSADDVTGGTMTWVGNNATNPTFWDVETTPNWTGANPNTFFQNDVVIFNDTASSYNVDIQTTVEPATMTINNATHDYTFAGLGRIAGATSLTKTGAGALSISNSNTYVGPTTLSGGATINTNASPSPFGTGALNLNGITIHGTAAGTNLGNSSVVTSGTNVIRMDGAVDSGGTVNIATLSGSGNLTLTTTVGDTLDDTTPQGKWYALNGTGGFTGTLNLTGPTDLIGMTVRTTSSGGGTQLGSAVVNMTNASMANRQGGSGDYTFTLGELHGDANSNLIGFIGGTGGRANTIFEIGALNTNSDFAGGITDPGGTSATSGVFAWQDRTNNSTVDPVFEQIAITSLRKVGTGTLTLTGLSGITGTGFDSTGTVQVVSDTYSGNTYVDGGTLSTTTPYFADFSDIFMAAGTVLDLNFAGTDVVDSLYLGNAPQNPGTYGAIGSGATFQSAFFTGTGMLSVTTLGTPITTPGDFDGDGDVDGRDFLVWQRNTSVGNLADWQANYGFGTLAALSSAVSVPEPACLALVALCGLFIGTRRRG